MTILTACDTKTKMALKTQVWKWQTKQDSKLRSALSGAAVWSTIFKSCIFHCSDTKWHNASVRMTRQLWWEAITCRDGRTFGSVIQLRLYCYYMSIFSNLSARIHGQQLQQQASLSHADNQSRTASTHWPHFTCNSHTKHTH